MTDMISQDMYEANLGLLQRRFPLVHAQIAGLAKTISQPVVEDGVVVDIDLGSGRLYRGDARHMAAEQVRDFVAAPSRSGYDAVEGVNSDSIISRRFYDAIQGKLRDMGVSRLGPQPKGRASFLFVFGIGLGYHLRQLAQSIDVDHVIILEAVDEFLSLSLRAIDWVALDREMGERGQTLHLGLANDPVVLSDFANKVVDEVGEMFLDGAYLYRHYPFWQLDEAYTRLADNIPFLMVGRGYYEDERKMLRNAAANLHKYDHYLVRGRFRRRYDIPAFIIGAGPSLDESLDFIRQWQHHAIIFCAGTTLQALVEAGITPDYHVELENVTATYQLCHHIMDSRPEWFPERRFTNTKMIASVTVNPMVPPLFGECYFFYRDCATSTATYGEDIEVMNGVGPTITNTSISVAARLGFDTMYLFGVDCGWRDENNHHAKNTMYYTMDQFKASKYKSQFSSPGNFGGTIHSDMIFTWTRDLIEQKVAMFGLKIYNCSDGAFIRGTTPKLPESLFFPGAALDKEKVFKRVRDESEFFAAGEFLKNHDNGRYLTQVDKLRADFNAFIDEAQADGIDFRQFIARLTDFNREAVVAPYKQVYALFCGATIGLAKAMTFYMNRVEDDDIRRPLMDEFLRVYRHLHQEMFDEGYTTFAEAKDMAESGIEAWWADGKPRVPGTTY